MARLPSTFAALLLAFAGGCSYAEPTVLLGEELRIVNATGEPIAFWGVALGDDGSAEPAYRGRLGAHGEEQVVTSAPPDGRKLRLRFLLGGSDGGRGEAERGGSWVIAVIQSAGFREPPVGDGVAEYVYEGNRRTLRLTVEGRSLVVTDS